MEIDKSNLFNPRVANPSLVLKSKIIFRRYRSIKQQILEVAELQFPMKNCFGDFYLVCFCYIGEKWE